MPLVRAGFTRDVTDDEVERFWADGVVHLEGVLDPDFVGTMAPAIERLIASGELADLTLMGAELSDETAGDGRFLSGVDHWMHHAEFRDFAARSALPALAGALIKSDRVYLYEDSVLVKEPHTANETKFHTDMGYFHVDGDQVCTTWVPLDPATPSSGAVAYVRASHRWDDDIRPNLFVTDEVLPGTDGVVAPDVAADPGRFDVISFESQPGDVVIHHARTLHGAPGNSSATRRRAISVRYCGDDARYRVKPGAPLKPHHHEVRAGASVEHEACPMVWEAATGTSLHFET